MRHRRAVLITAALMLGAAAGTASAVTTGAPRLYWGVESFAGGAQSVSWAPLDGSGPVRALATSGATLSAPNGIALDPSRGFIYWVNWTGGQVSRANLDGSGGGRDLYYAAGSTQLPVNIAVDPHRNALYWTTATPAAAGATGLETAPADGSGTPAIVPVQSPAGTPVATNANTLALDVNAGALYWTTDADLPAGGAIRQTALGTGATRVIPVTGSGAAVPDGLAVDAAAGWAMFANFQAPVGATPPLGIARLDGSGASAVDPGVGALGTNPMGVAVDPHAGVAYWSGSPALIRRTRVAAPHATTTLYADAAPTDSQATYLAILAPPRALAQPHLVGEGTRALPLSCGPGAWEADRASLQYYSAPAGLSYAWERNGAAVAGATSSSLVAPGPGAYTCTVTAANAAGSTTSTSAARTVASVRIRSVRATRDVLVARVAVSTRGRVTMAVTIGRTGARACSPVGRTVAQPGTVAMRCAIGAAVGRTRERRPVPVRVTATFHPVGAATVRTTRRTVLARTPVSPAVTG